MIQYPLNRGAGPFAPISPTLFGKTGLIAAIAEPTNVRSVL
jgi:hypothetical protein